MPESLTAGLLSISDAAVAPLAPLLDPGGLETLKAIVLLLTINRALFVVGMFLDAGPALLIMVPVLMPISQQIHMDKIHFAVMVAVT